MSRFIPKIASRLFNILITTLFAVGCGHNPQYVSVRDTAQPPSEKLKFHTVAKGETLYSIAWRYNLDYQNLAKANAIDKGFRIYPGQRLRLVDVISPVNQVVAKKPKLVKPSPKKPPPKKARSKKETPKVARKSPSKTYSKPKAWLWPASGKLLSGFQSNKGLNKGIDIRGNMGEPVLAAEAGKVVYSGDGLRGYGKLLIIKHNEKYLSAYAHNRRLLISEGAYVSRGQKIAEMGSSGTDTVKLHFEIRYDGRPVNPLNYLPKR